MYLAHHELEGIVLFELPHVPAFTGQELLYLLRFASEKVIHRLERLVLQELQVVPAALFKACHKRGIPLLQAVLDVVEQQPASALLVGGNGC